MTGTGSNAVRRQQISSLRAGVKVETLKKWQILFVHSCLFNGSCTHLTITFLCLRPGTWSKFYCSAEDFPCKAPGKSSLKVPSFAFLLLHSIHHRDFAPPPNLKFLDFPDCFFNVESAYEHFRILPDFAFLMELVLPDLPEMTGGLLPRP